MYINLNNITVLHTMQNVISDFSKKKFNNMQILIFLSQGFP